MLGAIIGDIVGSRFEFDNYRKKDFELFNEESFFTDDTVLTVAIADWLLHSKVKSIKTASKYIMNWAWKYPNSGYGNSFARWMRSYNPQPYGSYGNGAAMRISPVGWANNDIDEIEKLSDIATGTTHNHLEGLKGAKVVAHLIYMARNKASKEEMKDYASKYYDINFNYDDLVKHYFFNETCQETVPQAIYCFLISESFEDCVRTSISIGGDCDTLAAISSAIAEAYYGIPKEIEEKVMTYLPKEMQDIIGEFRSKYYTK